MVSARGGTGIALRTDHAADADVAALARRVNADHGRLDILIMDFWGDESPVPFATPFWQIPLSTAEATISATLWPHVRTLQALVPLMRRDGTRPERPRALIVEVMDGPGLYYRSSLFFDSAATLRARLADGRCRRSRASRHHGDWRQPGIPAERGHHGSVRRDGSELARRRGQGRELRRVGDAVLLGRGLAALAADPDSGRLAGNVYGSWDLARAYGVTHVDGSQPDFGSHFRAVFGDSPTPCHTAARWMIASVNSKTPAGP